MVKYYANNVDSFNSGDEGIIVVDDNDPNGMTWREAKKLHLEQIDVAIHELKEYRKQVVAEKKKDAYDKTTQPDRYSQRSGI